MMVRNGETFFKRNGRTAIEGRKRSQSGEWKNGQTEDDEEEQEIDTAEEDEEEAVTQTAEALRDVARKERDAESEPENPDEEIPCSNEICVPAHSKIVNVLTLNPKASRMITGGADCLLRMWEFNGMTRQMRYCKQWEPKEGHAAQAADYAYSGGLFTVAAGDAICRIYNPDGHIIQESVKGDMYIRDMNNTKGHTHMITDCKWHPFREDLFITSANDGTVRMWDINAAPWGIDQALPHLHCLKAVDRRNLNISNCHVLCCAWATGDAKSIVGGCVDGSIQLWNERKCYGKPDKIVRSAHGDSEVTGLSFYSDSVRFLSRGLDDTLKLWDVRNFKESVKTCSGLNTAKLKTNVCLSVDEKFVLTGTQANPKAEGVTDGGQLHVFNASDMTLIKTISFPTGIIRCEWPVEINQILLSSTDGGVRILYSPTASRKGALLFVERAPAKQRLDDTVGFVAPIYTPGNLPQGYKETRSGNIRKVKPRGKEKERIERETQKTIVPLRPAEGAEGSGGQRAPYGANMSQFIIGQMDKQENAVKEKEDPVEILRAYAQKSKDNPQLTGKAYAKTQPVNILDYTMDKGDDEALLSTVRKCPRCGLKMCQCGYMELEDMIKGPQTKQRKFE